jgi:plasmid stabilization system protein ParE
LKLILSKAALADLNRLHAFLADKNPPAATRAVARICGAAERLLSSPGVGRVGPVDGTRELVVPFGKSAYVIRYSYMTEANEVLILRIWHGREDR